MFPKSDNKIQNGWSSVWHILTLTQLDAECHDLISEV